MEEAKISLDALVPKNHLVHKIDKILLFDFIYPIVESTYSTIGRPSVDPVILVKLVFIQYLFRIRSMRQSIKEAETNLAYRWFLGLSLIDKIPHFSTFGKNYVRHFRETDCLNRYLSLSLNKQLKLDLFMKKFCIWVQPILKRMRKNIFLQEKWYINKPFYTKNN